MNRELSNFASRLSELIRQSAISDGPFNKLALELFALQFKRNSAYRKICEVRKLTPQVVEHWAQVPFVPTRTFKELEFSCIPPHERTAVFHSSGTTEQNHSRHFHCAESLALYEISLWKWFEQNIFDNSKLKTQNSKLIVLAPSPKLAPHSSLVHMFETIRQNLGVSESVFVGKVARDNSWILDFDNAEKILRDSAKQNSTLILLGTAFSFVHLLDFLAEKNLQLRLPENSRVMETGGYKNRSRAMPKSELHTLIEKFLGVPRENIICEYGMSELSSQAYDSEVRSQKSEVEKFQFPPWARAQIISPETGREVADDETGLIRIFDLANVFSVAAIQTEDLGIRRGDGFELIGRAEFAEPRGCSLMNA
jgi:Acyl-protein synthetase, LuxE